MRNGPEEEENGEPAGERAHAVDGTGSGVGIIAEKDDEEAAHEDEERGAGRVGNLEAVAAGDELTAVPKATGGFHGQDKNGTSNEADDPSGDAIEPDEVAFCNSSLHINELWVFFTKENAGCQSVEDQVIKLRAK